MPKVLLVSAPAVFINEPWFDEPDFPRTSLAFLAAYVRAHSSYEVYCLDAKFERLTFEQTIARIAEIRPDVVGFSAFTIEINANAYLAGLVKRMDPAIITIVGGAHVTAIPRETLYQFPTFDYAVIGDGEETLMELLHTIESGGDMKKINGLAYRSGTSVVLNPSRPRILDQDALPMPAWDLMPAGREYFIQTERGCPFSCIFCLNHNGRIARKRSPAKVIEEMEWLIAYAKPERISFGDELFSVDMKRAGEILDLMVEHKIGDRVSWDIQTHVSYVDAELFAKMKKAKITKCEMGVETGDDAALKKVGKAVGKKEIIKAFGLARKYGIKTGSFFILGHPNETYRSMWNTIKLGIKINPTEPIIGTMVPYPGTEVANMAAKGEGGYRLISTNWEDYGKQLNGSLQLVNISRFELDLAQITGYTLIFLLNFRFLAFFRFLFQYRTAAFNLLKKVVYNRESVSDFIKVPADYYTTINKSYEIKDQDLVESRLYWKKYQSDDVKYIRNLKPELILEQMPLKAV